MKAQISSVDLHYLVEEMQSLVGGRIDKIYHPKKEEVLFQFYVSSKGKFLLRIISGKIMFLSVHKGSYAEPSGFCMFLRKYLGSSRIRSISQAGSERVVVLGFDGKDSKHRLYIELFGQGNIVLTDEKDIIINALQQKKWADREVRKGVEYSYPKREHDFFTISKADFFSVLRSNEELVLLLAKEIGLGGKYAEEVCLLAGVEKSKKKLTDDEKLAVFNALRKILKKPIKAQIVFRDKKIKEIYPFVLSELDGAQTKDYESFNAAYDFYYKEEFAAKDEFVSKHQKMIDKTAAIVAAQQKQIEKLEKKAADNNQKGELLYEHYSLIVNILGELNRARETLSFDEIKKKLRGHKTIKEVDGKNKKIVVDL